MKELTIVTTIQATDIWKGSDEQAEKIIADRENLERGIAVDFKGGLGGNDQLQCKVQIFEREIEENGT